MSNYGFPGPTPTYSWGNRTFGQCSTFNGIATSKWISSPSSSSSSSGGDSSYVSSPGVDDDDFLGGNSNDPGILSAPCRKRGYTFIMRQRRAKPLKNRFSQSLARGIVQSEERFAEDINGICICKKKCYIAFHEELGLFTELMRCRNEYHSLRKHSDRRMYLKSLLAVTGDKLLFCFCSMLIYFI